MALLLSLLLFFSPPAAGSPRRLLAQLHLHTRGLHYRIRMTGPRPGLLGITDTTHRRITIYRTPGEPDALLRKVLAYEIAHAIDVTYLTDADHTAWLRARHAPPTETWWAPNLAPENTYGSGDYADCLSAWATHSTAYWRSNLPPPTPAQLDELADRYFHQPHRDHRRGQP